MHFRFGLSQASILAPRFPSPNPLGMLYGTASTSPHSPDQFTKIEKKKKKSYDFDDHQRAKPMLDGTWVHKAMANKKSQHRDQNDNV